MIQLFITFIYPAPEKNRDVPPVTGIFAPDTTLSSGVCQSS
jgi:hypothetical protein